MDNTTSQIRDVRNISLNLYKRFQMVNKPIEDIAYELGVEPRTIYYWTSGERIPGIERLIEISNYLLIKVDDLLV